MPTCRAPPCRHQTFCALQYAGIKKGTGHNSAVWYSSMVFLHLFIVNKSGGLIHHRPLSSKAPRIATNEWLRIGSTFHSLHAIAAEASPLRMPGNKNAYGADDGIEEIQAAGLMLKCFQTRTGVKFVVT